MHLPAQRPAEGGACQRMAQACSTQPPPRGHARAHTHTMRTDEDSGDARARDWSYRPRPCATTQHTHQTVEHARVCACVQVCAWVCVCVTAVCVGVGVWACDTGGGKHTGRIVVPALRARCYPYRRRCIAQARTAAYSACAYERVAHVNVHTPTVHTRVCQYTWTSSRPYACIHTHTMCTRTHASAHTPACADAYTRVCVRERACVGEDAPRSGRARACPRAPPARRARTKSAAGAPGVRLLCCSNDTPYVSPAHVSKCIGTHACVLWMYAC